MIVAVFVGVWCWSTREHKTWWFKKPVECNFDHVSHSGLFLWNSLCYWDILWTTLEHYTDGTMVHELDTANNYFCIYEKIKFAPFFWPTLYELEEIDRTGWWSRTGDWEDAEEGTGWIDESTQVSSLNEEHLNVQWNVANVICILLIL